MGVDRYRPGALLIERAHKPQLFDIEHVKLYVSREDLPGFLQLSKRYVEKSYRENGCMRFDFMRKLGEPATETAPYEFMFTKVYKQHETTHEFGEPWYKHFTEKYYLRWREIVAPLMAKPRVEEKFYNIFPSNSAGWGKYGADPWAFR